MIVFLVLASLSFSVGAQKTAPIECRGKPLPIAMLPGPPMTSVSLPLRFGGIRPLPGPPINSFPSDKALRLVIKTRDEFSEVWKQITARVSPDQAPPPPEVDFSKELVVLSAMGTRPTSGYWTIIDGACEVDGHVEVFITNVDDNSCGALTVLTSPADAVRLPQTDLPIVFRETQINCMEWHKLLGRLKK